jgi:uncharacterized protein
MSIETAAPLERQRTNSPSFHLLAKPSGSTCNIDCTYCFFLSKEALYPNDKQRMSEATLDAYIRQLLESHRTPEVTVARFFQACGRFGRTTGSGFFQRHKAVIKSL